SRSFSSTELDISNIVDLKININDINEKKGSDTTSTQIQPPDLADLIYDPSDVLNGFLEYERY
ncbi:16003_t:CDS:1, partial [Funneliformis caledonium]